MNKSNSADLATKAWPAPAKLNLFLHIVGQREDGCHLLQSAIQFIDLCDELIFDIRSDVDIRCENSNKEISQQDDLSVRAAKLLQKTCSIQQGVHIKLKKVIPMGAGLGGGSSDAATTLLALNRIWNCDLEPKELENLGLQLGADVPVFVRGEACWVEGIGEVLEPIALPESWYVVVSPDVHLNTRQMFAHSNLTRNCAPIRIRDFTQQRTQNVFEPIARQQPKVEHAYQWLNQYSLPRLAGSGSGLFTACESQQHAEKIAASCPKEFLAYVTKGLNRSPAYSLCEYN